MTTVVFQVGNDMLLATFMQTMIAAAGVTSSISVLPGRLNQMEETTNRALAAAPWTTTTKTKMLRLSRSK